MRILASLLISIILSCCFSPALAEFGAEEKVQMLKELANSKELQSWDWEKAVNKVVAVISGNNAKRQQDQDAKNGGVQYHKVGFIRYIGLAILCLFGVVMFMVLLFLMVRSR